MYVDPVFVLRLARQVNWASYAAKRNRLSMLKAQRDDDEMEEETQVIFQLPGIYN